MRTLLLILLSVSPAFATSYYVDYSTGADSNAGTKLAPFKNIPQSVACTSACATAGGSLTAGDQVILKGGVTWPMNTMGCILLARSGSSSADIYYGVDVTWYTGASWTRPILTGNGVTTGTCAGSSTVHNVFIVGNGGDYVTVDNWEFTDQLMTAGTGEDDTINFYGTFLDFTIENSFFHGWTLTGSGSGSDTGLLVYYSPGNTFPRRFIVTGNVFDGYDTTQVQADPTCASACLGSVNAFYGFATEFSKNVVRNVSNGAIGQINFVHDNLFENIRLSIDNTSHENAFENNSGCNARIYNNVIRNNSISTSIVNLWDAAVGTAGGCTSGTDYVFNNLVYNTSNANIVDLGTVEGCPGSCPTPFGTTVSFNNTVEAGPNGTPAGLYTPGDLHSTGAQANNVHLISSTATPFQQGTSGANCPQTNCTLSANRVEPYSVDCTTNGYCPTQTWPFSPTAGASPTVGNGNNYTSLCSIDAYMANACQDTTLAVIYSAELCTNLTCWNASAHTVTFPFRTPLNRPAVGAWDQGAYQLSSIPPVVNAPGACQVCQVTKVSPPTNLQAVLNGN